MDVYCAKCLEPWDHYHMRNDEPFEIWDGIDGSESCQMAHQFVESGVLTKEMRKALGTLGWKFGDTVYAILECACCGPNAKDNGEGSPKEIRERQESRKLIESLMPGDIDGIISELNYLGYRELRNL